MSVFSPTCGLTLGAQLERKTDHLFPSGDKRSIIGVQNDGQCGSNAAANVPPDPDELACARAQGYGRLQKNEQKQIGPGR
jgi:hypothetical protein